MSLPVLFSLGESNIERLGNDDPSVHLSDGFGCLLRRREATETEALAPAFLVHHLGAGDCPVGSKLFPKPLIVNGVVKVLDVEVDALVSVQPFQLQLLERLLQLPLMLGLSGSDSGWQSLLAFLQLLPGVYADKCSSTAF